MEITGIMKNRKDLLTGLAVVLFLCLLFAMAFGVTVRADDGGEDPGTAYYADIKAYLNCDFYDGDSHCVISAKPGIYGDIIIPAKVTVKAGDGVPVPSIFLLFRRLWFSARISQALPWSLY